MKKMSQTPRQGDTVIDISVSAAEGFVVRDANGDVLARKAPENCKGLELDYIWETLEWMKVHFIEDEIVKDAINISLSDAEGLVVRDANGDVLARKAPENCEGPEWDYIWETLEWLQVYRVA